jgi:hypothetical protein
MRKLAFCILFATLAIFTGCSSGPAPIAVTVTAPTAAQALDVGQTLNITATVSNDKLAKGATFSLSGPGALSNQTPASATFTASASGNATITVASVSDPTKMQTVSVVVSAMPSITSAATFSPATEGTAYSGTITVTGGAGALNYSVTVGTLPSGLSLNSSTGAITGTATGPSGAVSFTLQVKDSSTAAPQTNSKAISITINQPPAPQFTTTTLPADVEGTAYSQPLALTGGLAPFTYSISAGALPAGLSISAATGAITGTPTGPNGSASFTVKVVDSSNPVQSASQPLTIAVNLPPAPAITTASLPSDVEGTAYNQTVVATGGLAPLTYSVSVGSLPAGLSFNSGTGAITGTPTGPNGTASFTVKVTDKSNPVQTASQALSIAVNLPPAPAITTSSLSGGVEFANYNQTVAATGFGTLHYSVSVGSLPAGLSLNVANGAITGAPSGPNATASFTIQVTDSSNPVQTASQALSIAVSLPPAPSITTTTLPNGTVGANYNQTIALTGGHGPFTWSISSGALPTGFSLNAATGAITGSSSPASSYSFTVKVVDSSNPAQTASQALSISIVNGPLLVIPATLPTGAINDVYPSTTLGASGGLPPYTWAITVGTLPAGLLLNSSTGAITGTPTGPSATANFTAQVTDSTSAKQTGAFSITVNPSLAITSTSLPGATAGTNYSTNLSATGGVTPYNWNISVGSLPTGMNLSGNAISGIPTTAGTVSFSIQVNDASGGSQTAAVSIVVAPAPSLTVVTTSGSLPQGVVSSSYASTQLNANGGFQPYTSWIVVAPGTGTLPPGLSLSSSGQISGTPTAAGTYPFTVQVTDSATPTAGTAQANLTITINSVSAASCTGYGTGNESALKGSYAFLFQGINGAGTLDPFAAAGSFAADGTGKITSGGLDVNQSAANGGPQLLTVVSASSSYSLGSDDRGCMILSFGGSNQVVLHFAVGGITSGVASKARVIEFDDTNGTGGHGAGIFRLQTAADFGLSHLNARYVFGLDGTDISAAHFALGGAFNVNTSTGALSSGYADVDDGGSLISGIIGATGSIGTVSTTTGRATCSFNGGASATFNWACYVVNKNELFIVSTDAAAAGTPIASGRAIVTGSSFSNASLNGKYIIHLSGSGGGSASVALGLLTLSGGTLNGTVNQYSAGSPSSTVISGGTYSVNATSGRVTVTGAGNHAPVLYLTTPTDGISAFIIGTDGSATFGLAESQPAGTYSTSSLSGNGGKFFFGLEDPSDNTIDTQVGTVIITPSTGAVTGSQDSSGPNSPFLQVGKAISGTFVINSDGTGNIGTGTVLITNGTKIFFIDEGGGSSPSPAKISVVEQ